MSPVDPPADWRRVSSVDELAAKGRIEVLLGRQAVLLIWAAGAPKACAALCPHAFAPLIDGELTDGRIHCARHQASFDLETGAPDPRWQIPPLRIYPVRIIGGWVEIAAPAPEALTGVGG